MRKLQFGLDRYRTRTKPDVPERAAMTQVEHAQCQQPDGHLGNHIYPTVEQKKCLFRHAKRTRTNSRARQDQTVGSSKCIVYDIGRLHHTDTFVGFVTQPLADGHAVIVVTVFEHPRGNDRRRLLTVGQHAD